MILVVGASGLLGTDVCRRLGERGEKVRALVRETTAPAKLQQLAACGAELVRGDLKNPDSLAPACRGVSAVISTASSTLSRQSGDGIDSVDLAGQLSLVDAVKAAGVERFVFVSFRDIPELKYPLSDAKRAVERAIADLNYTTLRPTCFMEVWLGPALGFDYVNRKARIFGTGTRPISWISYKDVAGFCVESLYRRAAERATIEIGGPEALSQRDVVKIFEQAAGAPFELEEVPETALRSGFSAAGDPMQKSFAGLMLMVALGDAIDMAPVLAKIPLPLTPVRDYARAVLGIGAAPSS